MAIDIDSYFEVKAIKIFHFSALIFLVVLFLILLYKPITTLFHETDYWWTIPTLSKIAENNSFFETIKTHLFNPYLTSWGEPSMNIYLFLILRSFGFQAKYFIFISIFFHFFCSLLLYLILRKIKLDFRVAFFSALVFMTMLIHFCYYFWPMSAQHLIVIFFTLVVLNLYLKTTQRIDAAGEWRPYFRLTLFVNFIASFSQIAIFILPASLLMHILTCSRDNDDRIKKYEIWLPLFITYLGYPFIRLTYIGYPNLEKYLHATIMQADSAAIFPIIFVLGVGILLLFRFMLKLCYKFDFRKIFLNLLIVATILYFFLFLWLYGKKELLSPFHERKIYLVDFLSPYNFIRPFIGAFIGFLKPFSTALKIDSTIPYHYVIMEGSIVSVLLTLFFIFIFIKKFVMRHKGLIIFFVLYGIALPHMWRKGTLMPSRYFVYITPLFSVIFCSVFLYLYTLFIYKINLKKTIKEIILLLFFFSFCIPNMLAIRLEVFRGRLVNTFFIYDYIKIADGIKNNVISLNFSKPLKASNIYINGMLPMPLKEVWHFSPADPLKFDTFRYTFAQVFNDDSMLDINVNKSRGEGQEDLVYTVKDVRINNSIGINIEPFGKDFSDGLIELKLGRHKEASIFFQKAIERRPFLINYVLSGYRLEDLKWITNGRNMRQWIADIISHYNRLIEHPLERAEHISNILNKEIDDYIECFFYLSYLKHFYGEFNESEYLFSQIRFLESDYNKVSSWLSGRPVIKSNKNMLVFLRKTNTYEFRNERNTRVFLKFISKLILNKDMIKQDG